MITRLGQVRSAMLMGLKGRYLSEGVRNMVRALGSRVSDANNEGALDAGPPERPNRGLVWGFSVCPVLLAPTVSAWGLLRLGAQKEKRERKQRPGAVLEGRGFRAE